MKKIKLTQGKYTLVDDADFVLLNQHKWYCSKTGYAQRGIYSKDTKTQKKVSMHRVINNTPANSSTDHINGDSLDNRRCNLRTCSQAENTRNKVGYSSCGYKGVTKERGRYKAQIKVDGRSIFLGSFEDASLAAGAYITASLEFFGEFARGTV